MESKEEDDLWLSRTNYDHRTAPRPDLSLILEEGYKEREPFVSSGPARSYLRDDVLNFEIPEEHVEKFYIPTLLQLPTTKEIHKEVINFIEEKVKHALERDIKGMDFEKVFYSIFRAVSKKHKDTIEKRREEIEDKAKEEAAAEKKKKRSLKGRLTKHQRKRPKKKSWSKMRQEANRLRVDRFKDKVNRAYSKMKQGDVGDSTLSEKINELRYDNKEFQGIMEKKAYEMEIPRKNLDENRQVITGSFPRKYLYGDIQDETQMGRKAYNHLLATLDEYNES